MPDGGSTSSSPRDPGTLTSLLNEVFRGADAEGSAWVEGLAPGSTLGRYDLIRQVGRGGAGVVWEARDRELGRRVAVKVMRARKGARPEQRLIAEAEVAARLNHPGIVTTLDVGRNGNGAWLVQEFLVGRTLAARLEEGAMPLREALGVAGKVAAALAYAHRHGVVHRDLSPANVFLCEDGQVKLLDLGMAQAFGRRKLEGGTPDCMAPEQARGLPEDERVDVYGLGVLIHRMVTGQSPFPEGIAPDRRDPPHLEVADLPGLGPLLDRMLAKDPGDRPRDAVAVLAEIEELAASLPRMTSTTSTAAVRVRRRRPRWATGVAVTLALLATGAGGLALGRRGNGAATGGSHEPVLFGASATSSACVWGPPIWTELDRTPDGAVTRNGKVGGQGIAEAGGRTAWVITSDWGQLALPLAAHADADTFAVEVQIFVPPLTGWGRGASLTVFSDPVGGKGSGILDHGLNLSVAEEPGKPPTFDMFQWDGRGEAVHRYRGSLPERFTGSWHLLRIEGSRSRKWIRGLLDDRLLVVAHGDFDLRGRHVVLGSGYGYTRPEDVAFSNLRTFWGTPECQ